MLSRTSKFAVIATVAMFMAVVPAFAGRSIQIRATLADVCPGSVCATDTPGFFSMLPDGGGPYVPTSVVQSEILTHNAVYTLDTLDSLVNGQVSVGITRTAKIHFYTSVGNQLPACWLGPDQNQAVNWSIFSENSMSFTDMTVGQSYPGHSRADFNVRETVSGCNTQIFRFWTNWSTGLGGVTITRTSATQWVVTTDVFGEASLYGQGGRKGQTQYYGDYRLPFKLTLDLLP